MHLLTEYLHLEGLIRENSWSVLVIVCLVGVVPESGPHPVFGLAVGAAGLLLGVQEER